MNIDRKKGFHKHVDTQNYDHSDENILYKSNKTQSYFYLREKKTIETSTSIITLNYLYV